MGRGCGMSLGPLTAASVLLLTRRAQHSVKCRLGRQIATLVGQTWNDLAGWQVSVFRAVAQRQNGAPLNVA